MGRPPSTDRKEVVTLRLPQSLIAAYKAAGDDWRSRMEAAIKVALQKAAKPTPTAPAPLPAQKMRKAAAEPREAARERFTMDDVRPKFVSRLKPDKPKR